MSWRTESSPRRFSLRRRLLARMAGGFGGIIAIAAVALWAYARDSANRTYDLLLNGAALAILERAYTAPSGPTVDIPYSALEILGLAPDDRVFYRISLADGETLTGDPDLPRPPRWETSAEPRYFDAAHTGELVRFIVMGRRLPGGRDSRWIVAQVGHTRLARDHLEWSLIANGLTMLVFLSGVGLAFVGLGINRAMRPLTAIQEDLRDRAPTDLTPLQAQPPREVESLIAAINGFIQRLAVNQARTQDFIADVAHQTRTSLAALQGTLDSATRQVEADALAERLSRAQEQARRTVRLTNQLLAQAMVIHRAENTPLEALDPRDLVRNVLSEALRQDVTSAIDYGLTLDEMPTEGAWIAGDPVSLREALRNLLDNAVKHGPPDNRIEVTLARHAAPGARPEVVLSVEDAGPGIPAERRGQAQERFQSLGAGTRGSGLGLSIVRAVAEAHDARLSLGESRFGGLRVDIAFPERAAPAPPPGDAEGGDP